MLDFSNAQIQKGRKFFLPRIFLHFFKINFLRNFSKQKKFTNFSSKVKISQPNSHSFKKRFQGSQQDEAHFSQKFLAKFVFQKIAFVFKEKKISSFLFSFFTHFHNRT